MIPVTEGMENRDEITVTFVNVRVRDLVDTDFDADGRTEASKIADKLGIMDNIFGSAYNAVILVDATTPSHVSVDLGDVGAEEITDVEVTYTARDNLKDHLVMIALPDGWLPAYPPNDESRLC